nr:kelch domain-containing protein 1 isoform X3 [Oryctolagus cuniculus]
MADSRLFCVAEERSGHCAVVDGNFLYVWGGYVLYFVNLRTRDGTYLWEKLSSFAGQPPTPRDKLSCWVYKDRLIYFGGYGYRRHNELQDCFDVHDASWEEQIFWGWHNDVHVFDTKTQTWFQPEIKGGVPPQPRAAHTCAVLGNKGYIFGGRVLQTRMNDLHYLNLDTWTWSGKIQINGESPKHRSWHTLTPIADDKLFLFGGLSADNIPLSDGWIYNIITNCWKQLVYLPKTRPRLWHTACLGKENEIMVFGGSKDDLLSLDTGHCNDLLIFQTQPYSLLRVTEGQRKRERERERSSIHWFTPQMAATAGAGTVRSQEPGTSSRSPMWVQGPKYLGHLLLLSQAISRNWIRS